MLFPQTCEETLEAVKQGKFGQELKEAAESEPYVGVCAEQRIYVCDCCGYWDVHTDATVYGLADKEAGPASKFGTQTIEERGRIPYVARWEDEIGFRVIKEFVPLCEKCGGAMHAVEVDEENTWALYESDDDDDEGPSWPPMQLILGGKDE